MRAHEQLSSSQERRANTAKTQELTAQHSLAAPRRVRAHETLAESLDLCRFQRFGRWGDAPYEGRGRRWDAFSFLLHNLSVLPFEVVTSYKFLVELHILKPVPPQAPHNKNTNFTK